MDQNYATAHPPNYSKYIKYSVDPEEALTRERDSLLSQGLPKYKCNSQLSRSIGVSHRKIKPRLQAVRLTAKQPFMKTTSFPVETPLRSAEAHTVGGPGDQRARVANVLLHTPSAVEHQVEDAYILGSNFGTEPLATTGLPIQAVALSIQNDVCIEDQGMAIVEQFIGTPAQKEARTLRINSSPN
jgi:hypothetical protein